MFKVGDSVIHPEHGACYVEAIQDREMCGVTREYLVLKLTYADLQVFVPIDSTEVGLREVCSAEDVESVFEVLRTGEVSAQGNWSRRFKGNIERLHSGDIYQVAEVVRDLTVREREVLAVARRAIGGARRGRSLRLVAGGEREEQRDANDGFVHFGCAFCPCWAR